MKTRPKIYSYIRFSSPDQAKGNSLDRQLSYAKEYAKRNNMVLEESLTMRDEGLSAYHQTHIKRGAFGMFLSAIEAGKVASGSVLIIEALDRISRAEPIEAQAILSQIIMAGITVITASDNKVYEREVIKKDPMALVYSLLIFVRANEESETKSKRVTKSILSRIANWKKYGKGEPIRVGHDPVWVKYNKQEEIFNLINDKANIVKLIINLYIKGFSFVKITKHLTDNNINPLYEGKWNIQVIFRLISDSRLVGKKTVTIDGKTFEIKNYFPKILTNDEFYDLQQIRKGRASTKAQGRIPSIFTGMKICFCGYCLYSIGAQNHMQKIKDDRKVVDGYRRTVCSAKLNNYHKCPGSSSTSIVPIERTILEYCSDQMELSSMLGNNSKTSELKEKLSQLHHQAQEKELAIKTGEKSIVDLLSKGEGISIVNNIVEKFKVEYDRLVKETVKLNEELRYEEHNKASDIVDEWKDIKSNVYNLDENTRLMIRQLVKRTFKRIDIFLHGMQLSDKPAHHLIKEALGTSDNTIDLILTFHNDKTRILSIDKKTGSWVKGGNIDINVASIPQSLEEHQKTVKPALT